MSLFAADFLPEVTVLARDINGAQKSIECAWVNVCKVMPEEITDKDEILLVAAGDTVLWSALNAERPITIDDLTGFFA